MQLHLGPGRYEFGGSNYGRLRARLAPPAAPRPDYRPFRSGLASVKRRASFQAAGCAWACSGKMKAAGTVSTKAFQVSDPARPGRCTGIVLFLGRCTAILCVILSLFAMPCKYLALTVID